MKESKTLEPVLTAHPFFSGLDKKYIELLVGCATNVRFDAGKYLYHRDEEATHFYLFRSGKVALEIYSPERGPLILQTLGEGDILGWSWLFPPYRWCFDARAVEMSRAIALDGVCLRRKCEEDHTLGYELMKRFSHVIVQRLEATRWQLLDLYRAKK